jgi:hypothetical protein
MAKIAGMSYSEMLGTILSAAEKRLGARAADTEKKERQISNQKKDLAPS